MQRGLEVNAKGQTHELGLKMAIFSYEKFKTNGNVIW